MSNDPVKPGADADDLLGRWFAHHDKGAEDDGPAAPPRRVPIAARPSEAAAPRATRPSAAAVLAELRETPAVDRLNGSNGSNGSNVSNAPSAAGTATPATGVRRGLPGSAYSGPTGSHVRGVDSGVAELDRPAPAGFEPVILRSVRKKSEAKEEPEPKAKRGRLSRLRSRASAPTEPPAAPEAGQPVTLDDQPAAVAAPPAFKASPPAPAAPVPPVPAPLPTKVVSYEDVIARATAATLPSTQPAPTHAAEPVLPGPDTEPAPVVPEPEPQPEVEPVLPGPDTEPAPVVPEPEPEPQPEVEPVLPGPDTEPAPVVPEPEPEPEPAPEPAPEPQEPDAPTAPVTEAPTKRRLVARTKRPRHELPKEPRDRKRHAAAARTANASITGTGGAARGLLAAARAAAPAPPLASEIREPKVLEPVPMLPVETGADSAEPSAPPMEMPTVYTFAPRKAVRRFLSLMLMAGLIASGSLGYGAYESRDSIEIGIAGIAILATLVIWAIRAGATVTRLTVKSGQLEIVRQGGRMVFDLASNYTTIQATGRPGSKKWKVLFIRPGMAPVTVDSTMVDGRDFMRILGFYRPELAR